MAILESNVHQKVWGEEVWLVNTELYCCKILHLKADYRCSYHYHKIKDEVFFVRHGEILIKYAPQKYPLNTCAIKLTEGMSIRMAPYTLHSFMGLTDAEILEVSTQHFEDDSYREDKSCKVW